MVYPYNWYTTLKNKTTRTQQTSNNPAQTTKKKWIIFTYHSPLIHKVTNLFKNTNLHIAFKTNKTIYNYLCHQTSNNTPIATGIYRLQCKTCKKILCWSNWLVFNSTTSWTRKIHKNQQPSICIRDAYSRQPARIWQTGTNFTISKSMSKRKSYELLGIFIYTDTATTTTFIDRRTENQRLKPPVLSWRTRHTTTHSSTTAQ